MGIWERRAWVESAEETDFEGVKAGLLSAPSGQFFSHPVVLQNYPWVLTVWAGLAMRGPRRRYGQTVLQTEVDGVTFCHQYSCVCVCVFQCVLVQGYVCTCVCRRLRSTQMSFRMPFTIFF